MLDYIIFECSYYLLHITFLNFARALLCNRPAGIVRLGATGLKRHWLSSREATWNVSYWLSLPVNDFPLALLCRFFSFLHIKIDDMDNLIKYLLKSLVWVQPDRIKLFCVCINISNKPNNPLLNLYLVMDYARRRTTKHRTVYLAGCECGCQVPRERAPASPQPSVDRLSVTWADVDPPSMASGVNLFHLPADQPSNNEVKFSPAGGT